MILRSAIFLVSNRFTLAEVFGFDATEEALNTHAERATELVIGWLKRKARPDVMPRLLQRTLNHQDLDFRAQHRLAKAVGYDAMELAIDAGTVRTHPQGIEQL